MSNREDVPIADDFIEDSLEPKGKTFLFFIAIDQYKNGVRPLSNAVRDAQKVKECLLENYQLDEENCKALTNEQATRRGIIEAFDNYLEVVTDQDNFLFYFSGHGYFHVSTLTGYWLTVEAKPGQRETFFSNDEVIKFIRHLKARHVFGIVDSCFSGALFSERRATPQLSRRYHMPSRWLLTAGHVEPVSDGEPIDHSPFAKVLLNELRCQPEPQLWVSELCVKTLDGFSYTGQKQTPRGQPLSNVGNQGGELLLVRRRSPQPNNNQSEGKEHGEDNEKPKDTRAQAIDTKGAQTPTKTNQTDNQPNFDNIWHDSFDYVALDPRNSKRNASAERWKKLGQTAYRFNAVNIIITSTLFVTDEYMQNLLETGSMNDSTILFGFWASFVGAFTGKFANEARIKVSSLVNSSSIEEVKQKVVQTKILIFISIICLLASLGALMGLIIEANS